MQKTKRKTGFTNPATRGHRKVCIQNYGKEGQGILNGFGFLRTDSCPTGIQEKAF